LSRNFRKHRPIVSLKELKHFNREKIPYIYYEVSSGIGNVFEVDILPRQYMRQVIAAEFGIRDAWDWRKEPFDENIKLFVTKMAKFKEQNGFLYLPT